jgi:hypothetical protein
MSSQFLGCPTPLQGRCATIWLSCTSVLCFHDGWRANPFDGALYHKHYICRFPRRGCATIIEIVDQMNHETLSETVVKILKERYAKKVIISMITCDGASCQVKALFSR